MNRLNQFQSGSFQTVKTVKIEITKNFLHEFLQGLAIGSAAWHIVSRPALSRKH
jgi:hypothetical protein